MDKRHSALCLSKQYLCVKYVTPSNLCFPEPVCSRQQDKCYRAPRGDPVLWLKCPLFPTLLHYYYLLCDWAQLSLWIWLLCIITCVICAYRSSSLLKYRIQIPFLSHEAPLWSDPRFRKPNILSFVFLFQSWYPDYRDSCPITSGAYWVLLRIGLLIFQLYGCMTCKFTHAYSGEEEGCGKTVLPDYRHRERHTWASKEPELGNC